MRFWLTLFMALSFGAAAAAPIAPNEIKVIDGDTIATRGRTYRLLGFDAPEFHRAKCLTEAVIGRRAARRLQQLIDNGGLDLVVVPCPCHEASQGKRSCNRGRFCGRLLASGQDVGRVLIHEGLARPHQCSASRCPPLPKWC